MYYLKETTFKIRTNLFVLMIKIQLLKYIHTERFFQAVALCFAAIRRQQNDITNITN